MEEWRNERKGTEIDMRNFPCPRSEKKVSVNGGSERREKKL